jgi:hypothetical protein
MSERQTTGGTGRAPKRPYVAPVVEKVALRAEEAVLGFCKNSSIRGPRGGNCRAVGVCSTQGS